MVAVSSSLILLPAYSQTWDGGGDGTLWADDDNWDPSGVPVNDGTANLVFGTTGAGTVNYETTTRSFTDLTIQGTAGYTFSGVGGGELNWSGTFTNAATGGSQVILGNTQLTGTGSLLVQRNLRLGSFDNFGSRNNTFSGGVVTDGALLFLQYGNAGTGGTKTLLGTGDFQAGTGLLNSNGGGLAFNQIASARMTYANNFINAITRDGDFGPNQFEMRFDGGINANDASTTRLTGDFTTAALTGGSTGHGWTVLRGRAVTDATQFSASTFEISGDWTGYAPVSSKLSLMYGAFVLENANSVANHLYTLNANNSAARSTVLALGDGFGANTFNRAINIEVGSGGSNADDAVNQTYIGGRQGAGVTNAYSGNITFNNANAHRLNLFSESGRTEFSGNLSASANQVVAINSDYSMATYGALADTGATNDSALTAFTPDGIVVFNGGTKTFAGGLEVAAGALLVNQAITGDVTVSAAAILGTDAGGTVTGNLAMAEGARLVFDPSAVLNVTGTVTLHSTFGVGSLVNADGSALDWSLIADDTYTVIGVTASTFDGMIANYGAENAFGLGDGRSAYFQNGSLQLVVIPEPGTFALIGGFLALGFVMVRRRR